MATYGETYKPIIQAALNGDKNGKQLLEKAAQGYLEQWPSLFANVDEAMEVVKANLKYFSGYYGKESFNTVIDFYGDYFAEAPVKEISSSPTAPSIGL